MALTIEEQWQLNRIEKKQDKILKLLNPIVKIDKELRAGIFDVLAGKEPNNTKPRKQPKPDAWLKRYCNGCEEKIPKEQIYLDGEGNEYCKVCKEKVEAIAGDVAQDG